MSRVAAVTGGNRGIGFAIVRNLALQYPSSPYNSGPLLIYLTARNAERGTEAVKALANDPQLKQAKALSQDGGQTTIKFHELDIDDKNSIHTFASFLHREHPEGIDFVINNAGIAMEGYNMNVVTKTLNTNYYGTLEATQALLPLVRDGGRLCNVSSIAGKLSKYSDDIRQEFIDAAQSNVEAVTALMEKYTQCVADGTEEANGFPKRAYAVSKAGITAMTKAIALEEGKRKRGVLINVCCPGYVNTNMTKENGAKTPDEGAITPVMLVLQEIGGTTWEFWSDERVSEW
ncbi:NAD(P)-binding protein [Piedraia hortae CBS 480.64]|uniref:NAD(P)-binding protein n=1 Tax=Piedraia hortae CBS 480.64 TaxID=1314780 RepID=A0A6A7C501_9PEZI|nr:NAD(P)-binding protein [Piedraia hortae CBS 480.64]